MDKTDNKKPAIETVDAYIGGFPPDVQEKLRELRQAIRDAVPDAKEKMSYGMPAYEQNGILAYFGGFKQHIGFYPAPNGIQAFEAEVAPYHSSKGTLKFPLHKPMPCDLVARIVKYRAEQNAANARSKKK